MKIIGLAFFLKKDAARGRMRPEARSVRAASIGLVPVIALSSLLLMAGAKEVTARFLPFPAWVGTWSASPQPPDTSLTPTPEFNNQTLRLILHTTIGGNQLRIRISNAFGTQPLLIGDAHVAISGTASAIVPGTDHPLTFGGQGSVTIPTGAVVLSDPVNFSVTPLANLAVSLYLPNDTATTTLTEHIFAEQISYVSGPGDFSGSTSLANSTPTYSWFFLTDVEVTSPLPASVVVLGDSISDGFGSTIGANNRWPDLLAARLYNLFPFFPLSLVNQGIAGNRLLTDVTGPNASARFDRDVLSQPGVQNVILEEGLNDIGAAVIVPSEAVTADQIIAGLNQLIQRAHDQGLKVIGVTLTPFAGSFYYTASGETERQTVNQFIRTSGAYDGVFDFDQVVSDPNNPRQILAAYDSGDHLHPNDAGYQAIANSINLFQLFNLGW